MVAFSIIWVGQFVSLIGTGMTRFALTIFAWQLTGEVTALALMGFFAFGPTVLLSPFAGAIVDRASRKLVMMLSDLAAGTMTILILGLFLADRLEIWHLYVAGAVSGAFESFQFPAYSAAVSTMLPKAQYTRANGMMSLVENASFVISPILAGALIATIGIGGILTIDIISFVVAVLALSLVAIPKPQETEAGRAGRGSLWKEAGYGFRYILDRPSLLGLLMVFFVINFTGSFGFVLLAPMILARSGNQELVLGSVQSMFGIGGVVGGLLLSLWGGPKRRIHGVLLGLALASLLGEGTLGLGRGPAVWAVGAFFISFFIPIINGSSQAIWQAKVAPDVQGRVFSVRRMIAQVTAPVAILLAGPLADRVFEPGLRPGGALAETFGWLVGNEPGSGMALIFLVTASLGTVAALAGYLFPIVRNIEILLPDHEMVATPTGGVA
jgi:MFS family permease